MQFRLLITTVLLAQVVFAQRKDPIEVTPVIQARLKAECEKEGLIFKQKLEQQKTNKAQIEFSVDTFKAERLMSKWIALDYSDPGMREATYAGAREYDILLNKYYKKLLETLKPADKNVLVNAQKNWIGFRDSEVKLVETIGKDEYAGGGTADRLAEASEYLQLVKTRVIAIFDHYARATQNF